MATKKETRAFDQQPGHGSKVRGQQGEGPAALEEQNGKPLPSKRRIKEENKQVTSEFEVEDTVRVI